jgi:NAD(P)H-hydrate repair Nnr-like enzyme with NAD(P)H-hydrate dehydratase domain
MNWKNTMEHTYWHTQTPGNPLYPNIEWNKPEQRSLAGRLGIIGGNKLGFAGVAESYGTALAAGAGEVRVLLPDVLRKTVPPSITDAVFGATNPSGGLAKDAKNEMTAIGAWANGVLLVGDAGRNSETAILYEDFLQDYKGQLTLTRDAVDLVKNSSGSLVERPNTLLVVSFAQLQKLFQNVYYPKILMFSMQLASVVEAVHKFTTTYPCTVMVLHKDYLIVASDGEVTTTAWENPMAIWRGSVATKAACYWLWNPSSILMAATASIA